jgi:group I intron endonuclease
MGRDRKQGVAYLYVITRKKTGQIYVGISVNTKKRWNTHRWLANSGRSNQLLHRAMAKYGLDTFSCEVVACSENWRSGIVAEQQLIEQYGSHVSNGGYNLTFGGDGPLGRQCSHKTRSLISRANKGRPGRKNSDAERKAASKRLKKRWQENPEQFAAAASAGGKTRIGYKHPPETLKRMSEAAYARWRREKKNPLRVQQHH